MKWPWQTQPKGQLVEVMETKGNVEQFMLSLMQYATNVSGISVTPDNCEQSPTMKAIVTAVTRRFAITPVHVYKTSVSNGRSSKEIQLSHPVERLLRYPNEVQSPAEYWSDASSSFLRMGNYYAYKGQGVTGPIRLLDPMVGSQVSVKQDLDTRAIVYNYNSKDYPKSKIHHVRGPARNYFKGDSTVVDNALAIGLEIAAEKFGAAFFGNGAMPSILFKVMDGFKGFKTELEEKQFLADWKAAVGGNKQWSAAMLPKGIDASPVQIENDKAQFIETRKLIRTVIAGAFGVPPHLVGDLERGTFNNVEQQDQDFTINVVLPIMRMFESAMERDLLTQADRNSGIVIRFNVDAVQRGDFKTRQEGNALRRQWGVISANEWRENDGLNPISDEDGGDDYIRPLNFGESGDEPVNSPTGHTPPGNSPADNTDPEDATP